MRFLQEWSREFKQALIILLQVFHPGNRHKAIGTQVTDFALNIAEFRRIEAMADFDNTASQRVMERAGMARDALLRNRVTKPNGNQIDMVLYSVVKE